MNFQELSGRIFDGDLNSKGTAESESMPSKQIDRVSFEAEKRKTEEYIP
jgi:hypothetical protein